MARARNIKPGFFKNYELADLGPLAQVLFSGLWCLADREGRLEDKPRFIKAEIFPYYECDINGELTKLERCGFVRRYTGAGLSVIEVLNFKKHQSPHNTEKASSLPSYEQRDAVSPCSVREHEINGGLTVDSPCDNDGNRPDSLIPDSLIPDSLIEEIAPAKPLPARKVDRGTSLPKDWAPNDVEIAFCREERPDLIPSDVASRFRDYWAAQPGAKGRKTDWTATWRNWVRNERQKKFNGVNRHGNFGQQNYRDGVGDDGSF
jgi:hypothetical protein